MDRGGRGVVISGWRWVLVPFLVPVAIAAGLFRKAAQRTPGEVAGYISDFIDGTGGEWDWDDFTSVPIADSRLEAIREEAAQVTLPPDEAGLAKLRTLAVRARAMKPLA